MMPLDANLKTLKQQQSIRLNWYFNITVIVGNQSWLDKQTSRKRGFKVTERGAHAAILNH